MKRILLLVMLLLTFTIGQASAETWEQLSDTMYVDVDSIKKIQVDYDEIIKATTKSPLKDGGYSLDKTLINIDTKQYCITVMEHYDSLGKLTFKSTVNPKNKDWWFTSEDPKWIEEIIKRAN